MASADQEPPIKPGTDEAVRASESTGRDPNFQHFPNDSYHAQDSDGFESSALPTTRRSFLRNAARGMLTAATVGPAVVAAGETQHGRDLDAEIQRLRKELAANRERQVEARVDRAVRFSATFRTLEALGRPGSDLEPISSERRKRLGKIADNLLDSEHNDDPVAAFRYAAQMMQAKPGGYLSPEDLAEAFGVSFDEPHDPKDSARNDIDILRLTEAFFEHLVVYATGPGRAIAYADRILAVTINYCGANVAVTLSTLAKLNQPESMATTNSSASSQLPNVPFVSVIALQSLLAG